MALHTAVAQAEVTFKSFIDAIKII